MPDLTDSDDPRPRARPDRAALHAPFRPRRARRVGFAAAAAVMLMCLVLAVALPSTGPAAWHLIDRLMMVGFGLLVAAGLLRLVTVNARPTEEGLRVRNLVYSRFLDWPEIVEVRFGGGNPWAILDLADADTLAVMAVQRADGEHGVAEARRLATLVALHSRTDRND